MEDRALADRFIAYADALVAVSVVGMSGLSIALAEPDIRCSLTQAMAWVVGVNLVSAGIISALLIVLRSWESTLRSAIRPTPRAATYLRRLHAARLAIVWICAGVAVAMLLAAARDPACLG